MRQVKWKQHLQQEKLRPCTRQEQCRFFLSSEWKDGRSTAKKIWPTLVRIHHERNQTETSILQSIYAQEQLQTILLSIDNQNLHSIHISSVILGITRIQITKGVKQQTFKIHLVCHYGVASSRDANKLLSSSNLLING